MTQAQQILENGLKKAPASAEIYEALASLELRTDHIDQAVETLERGLKSPADKSNLRWILANVLAMRGDTGKLLTADRRTEENRLSRTYSCNF